MKGVNMEDFEARLNAFVVGSQAIIDKEWAASGFTHGAPPEVVREGGTRFIRITRYDRNKAGERCGGASVFAFIDSKGGMIGGTMHKVGDVLKPATWKAPAKHARGNIFDEHNGLRGVRWTGPAYLK